MHWKRLFQFLMVLLVMAVSVGLVLWRPPRDWSEEARVEATLESLLATNRAMQAENKRLQRLAEALERDSAVLEQAAREELGYIRDGEVVVVVPR